MAKLFRAAAEAETVHAHAHLRVMDGIKSTGENLGAAIEGTVPETCPVCHVPGSKFAEIA